SGEVGAVIVESAFIENHGRGFYGAVGIDKDDKIPGLAKLAKAIQDKGSKAIIQIYHAGRMGFPNMNEGKNPVSASPVAALRPGAPIP
ncbi:oxidoreductase, partial [Streptococcus pyogenes]